MKIGNDILNFQRIQNIEKFANRICTENELAYLAQYQEKKSHLGALFSCKESIYKALSPNLPLIFKEIEILHNPYKCPSVTLHGKTKAFFDQSGYQDIAISISHTNELVFTICMIQ